MVTKLVSAALTALALGAAAAAFVAQGASASTRAEPLPPGQPSPVAPPPGPVVLRPVDPEALLVAPPSAPASPMVITVEVRAARP